MVFGCGMSTLAPFWQIVVEETLYLWHSLLMVSHLLVDNTADQLSCGEHVLENFGKRWVIMIGLLIPLHFLRMEKFLRVEAMKKKIKLWDAFTGENLRTLEGHTNGVLAFIL